MIKWLNKLPGHDEQFPLHVNMKQHKPIDMPSCIYSSKWDHQNVSVDNFEEFHYQHTPLPTNIFLTGRYHSLIIKKAINFIILQ